MPRKLTHAVLVTAVVAVIAASVAGLARAAVTLSIGEPDLQAGVLITVPVTVTCSPFDPTLTLFSSSVVVQVEQANKQRIAFGTGSTGGLMNPPPVAFPCDGNPATVTVNVLANPNGAPFKKGKAAFTVSAFASAGISCGPGCFFNIVSQTGSTGPVILTMR
jgi:hypothetical protein